MPLLRIQTNQTIDAQRHEHVLKQFSHLVAQALGKPEDYTMIALDTDSALMFAGTMQPAAFVELKAIHLPADLTAELSRLLCERISAELGIEPQRVYLNFTDVPANFWGWNGETF